MNRNRKVRKRKIATKIAIILVVFGVIIAAAALLIGRQTFSDHIQKLYNDTAYQLADVAEGYFSEEELAEYADIVLKHAKGALSDEEMEKIAQSPRYQEIARQINNLRISMNANDIYVCALDVDAVKNAAPDAERIPASLYIVDSYRYEDQSFPFGYIGDFKAEFAQAILQIYESGERIDDYIISDGEFGYNTAAVHPVVQNGKTVAMIGVEIPMLSLQSTIGDFVRNALLITIPVFIILLILALMFSGKMIARPIISMAKATESYVAAKEDEKEEGKASPIEQLSVTTGDELEVLCRSLKEMEGDLNEHIENLKRVTAEKERIGAELEVATKIQAYMLPRIFPAFPEIESFDLYASMSPAKEVGGDFYDFFLVDDSHLAMIMADVSGKGVPAALFMVIAKTLIKNRAQMGGGPSEILYDVNNQLCEGNEADLFVTVWLAILDLHTGKGLAANAGHEHPAIRRAGGKFELSIYRHSIAVAAMEDVRFAQHEFELHPGDCLFVYTDGVPEATNAGGELYGTDRMLEALNRNPEATPTEQLEAVRSDVDSFVGDAPQFDDLTMLSVYFKGDKKEQ